MFLLFKKTSQKTFNQLQLSIFILFIKLILTNKQMTQTMYSYYDRFIDSKQSQNMQMNFNSYLIDFQSSKESNYSRLIKKNLFGSKNYYHQQMCMSINSTCESKNNHNIRNVDINLPEHVNSCQQLNKLSPVKILDVPNIKDNFYLNLVDWHQKGPIAIALNSQAWIYTPQQITKCGPSYFMDYISSIKFNESILSIGLSNGSSQIYDLQKNSLIRVIKNHTQRVSSIGFSQNMMISGSKDKLINLNDLRIKQSLINSFRGHNGEVCSLKVKPDQKNIFASGGNDNKVLIWDIRADSPIGTIKQHKGAIKAISWCPWKSNILATGGGNNDRTIKIWGQNLNLICQKQLKSQISGLEWNSKYKSLISSHGNNSNQICVWKWDNYKKIDKINGSKNYAKRVLCLIQSKQQDMVCTLSSDQTMKFFQFNNSEAVDSQKIDRSHINEGRHGIERIL